jgi:hypothetical protein
MFLLPSIPDPQDPTTPISNAIAWIAGLSIDFSNGNGQIVLNIHRSIGAANALAPPSSQVVIRLGEALDSTHNFPTLETALQDTEFASAWSVVRDKLYAWSKDHPLFANSTEVS